MAEIRPFKGLRYSLRAGDLSTLTAPPYDVITPSERVGFAARNEFNIVHLTLPEGKIDDRSKFVKYARGSALLSQWRREGIFGPDEQPSFYRYTQRFHLGKDQTPYVRTSLLCLLKIEPFESGNVLPHEQTFANHKEDRLRLLEATRTHLESIFGLFEDPSGELYNQILSAPTGTAVEAESDFLHQTLEAIVDPATIQALADQFSSKRIWIADGHHRYETALAFRTALGERSVAVAEDYILIALSAMTDPGLILLPTHRVVPSLKDVSIDEIASRLDADFEIERCHSSRLLVRLRECESAGVAGFGVSLEGGHALWLIPRDLNALARSLPSQDSERLRKLDSTILHKVIFERLLGLSPATHLEFMRDAAMAIVAADEGRGAAFLMVPPSVEDMKAIALSGERMPQKSTYYFPKIWSGFVAWGLEDFAE
jgi:uncharacterized protein (DUF1015 family)